MTAGLNCIHTSYHIDSGGTSAPDNDSWQQYLSLISWQELAHVMYVLQVCCPEAKLHLDQPERHLSVMQCILVVWSKYDWCLHYFLKHYIICLSTLKKCIFLEQTPKVTCYLRYKYLSYNLTNRSPYPIMNSMTDACWWLAVSVPCICFFD